MYGTRRTISRRDRASAREEGEVDGAMSDPNEVCGICGEPRHAHLPPGETHPRESRGEGRYEQVSAGGIMGGGAWYEDTYYPPTYRFVPARTERRHDP
jgi:hypothetical protein